jgi:hypothetical protein
MTESESEFRRACNLTREKIASKEVKKDKMANRTSLKEWANTTLQNAQDFPSIIKFQVGDNTLEILDSDVIEGKYGALIEAVVNGQRGRISLGKYLAPKVASLVSQGIMRMRVTRVGTGLESRFLVTPLTGKNPTETEKV